MLPIVKKSFLLGNRQNFCDLLIFEFYYPKTNNKLMCLTFFKTVECCFNKNTSKKLIFPSLNIFFYFFHFQSRVNHFIPLQLSEFYKNCIKKQLKNIVHSMSKFSRFGLFVSVSIYSRFISSDWLVLLHLCVNTLAYIKRLSPRMAVWYLHKSSGCALNKYKSKESVVAREPPPSGITRTGRLYYH